MVTPDTMERYTHGVSGKGQIVGTSLKSCTRGFLLQGGVFTQIDYPGAVATEAYGINKTGQIVGLYYGGGRDHGFVLQGGIYTTVDAPSSTRTLALGNNSGGQVAGYQESGPSVTGGC